MIIYIELMSLLNFLRLRVDKDIRGIDDPRLTIYRSKIIQKNIFLKNIYEEYYSMFRKSVTSLPKKRKIVEIGSGGGFIKKIIPEVLTSDILNISDVDLHFSATRMPFKNNSIDRFFLVNVIHHINDPKLFFKEVDRCLRNKGRLIAIEPANTLWGKFIYRNFHHEEFDDKRDWNLKSEKPLSDANGAIPWIVFVRDRKKFKKLFPRLKIIRIIPHTPIRYLASGGLSYRQMLPSWAYGFVKATENLLSPLNNHIGMFYTIEIEKN
jgi:SAM-dependent methyltransferase